MRTETDQYQLKITSSELTIKPYFGYMPKIKIFGLLSVLIFCIVPFSDYLNYNIRYVLYGIGGIMLGYAIYDFLFRAGVKFLFDKKTKTIYKIYISSVKKKLMTFDEMTIITTAEYGEIAYAIGRKKKQFLKNYPISDTYNNGKKDQIREAEYIERILNPIHEFINTQ